MTTASFPPGFLWGASTSAHQVEGNNVGSDFWQAENDGSWGLADRSGDACDSFHRWPEDLDLVRDLGLNAYRFSIEWARVVPAPGRPSPATLAHYRRIIEGCGERGLTPVVTLHHFTNPAWLTAEGGWTSKDAIAHFTEYVRAVLPVLDGVPWVCTINEPNMVAFMAASRKRGGGAPAAYLGPPDAEVTAALTRAHAAARDLLAAVPGLRSGWTVANQNVQDHGAGPDRTAEISYLIDDQYLDVAKGDDFVGVQAYSRLRAGERGPLLPGPDDRRTMTGWEYYPQALEDAVRHTDARLGGSTPLLVTENGIATGDDGERVAYTREAVAGLRRAMADGIDVRGYLHWSLLDNYEWGSWEPTFGLVAVDRTTFRRTVKPSARWFGRLARDPEATLATEAEVDPEATVDPEAKVDPEATVDAGTALDPDAGAGA
ncbi:family 1 glycosylhydrolase [Actinomadura sp. ATCC 31491]|uniref:Family 1 glycosylhydrolase n=1 Tax=Actinomadura luzonensis TaxID=2805427 RepID=A0ABT0FUM7_9ACTN|nr:family 1 glycosylhydrolase [Actinomadura luzonensis]MCK2216038.1 family 1 glycosylhydrolase [Actinomadura luzonensis]